MKMCEIFVSELKDKRVIFDPYFFDFTGEMITRDVDVYAREKYGEGIVHVFGTDTLSSMPSWDSEGYALSKIQKFFVPRGEYAIPE
jgi:nicotinic acid mononucleotide adenylyltransferase